MIAELLSLPNAAADLKLSPQRKRDMLLHALLHQLETIAARQPVLMVFEDAHWIDPTSRELLDLAIDRLPRLPVLLVTTFRPEFRPAWSGQPHVTALSLNRLVERDGAALVEQLAGGSGVTPEVVAEIVERTDGVPLFIEELTKAVLESGGQQGPVLAASPTPGLAIPATLHASLIARLDRLGTAAKETAQIGAVIGREFSYDLIVSVVQRAESDLRIALGQLTDAGLLFCRGLPPHASYLFKHALVQDAAYATLLRARRRELHARLATVLRDEYDVRAEARPELLAHHYTEAGQAQDAAIYWGRAARRSAARSAMTEAAAQFQKGLEQLKRLPDNRSRRQQELEILATLGGVMQGTAGNASPGEGARIRPRAPAMGGIRVSARIPQRSLWSGAVSRVLRGTRNGIAPRPRSAAAEPAAPRCQGAHSQSQLARHEPDDCRQLQGSKIVFGGDSPAVFAGVARGADCSRRD